MAPPSSILLDMLILTGFYCLQADMMPYSMDDTDFRHKDFTEDEINCITAMVNETMITQRESARGGQALRLPAV